MWGSPGTMLASLWLHEWTGQGIWAERFRRDAGLLWTELEFVEEAGCHLWVQNLYGHHAPHMGAVHGFAGNAFAVIRGWHLLSQSDQSRWAGRLAELLRRTARGKTIARPGRNPSASIVLAARLCWCSIVTAHLAS